MQSLESNLISANQGLASGLSMVIPNPAAQLLGTWFHAESQVGALLDIHRWVSDKGTFQPPPVGALLDARRRGFLKSDEAYGLCLKLQGVSPTPGNQIDQAWHDVAMAMVPYPSIADAINCLSSRIITPAEASEWMKRNGADPKTWEPVARAAMQHMSPNEALGLYIRGILDIQGLDGVLNRQRVVEGPERDAWKWQAKAIPGPSDLVRFAIKDVFDEELVKEFGLDAEFADSPDFQKWMSKVGYGWNLADEPGVGAAGGKTWASYYWRAAWQVISPTMAYEMLHRLRAGRMHLYPGIPGLKQFTMKNMQSILRLADYPEVFRAWLTAISFRPLGRIDIRRMARLGVIQGQEIAERHIDLGYSEPDAQLMRRYVEADIAGRNKPPLTAVSRSKIKQLWQFGAITDGQAVNLLKDLTNDAALADKAFSIMILEDRGETIAKVVAGIRRRFLSGELTAEQARGQLEQTGMQAGAVARQMMIMAAAFSRGRKEVTAGKVHDLACRGLIPLNEAAVRLDNLGYRPEDRAVLVAGIMSCIEEKMTPKIRRRAAGGRSPNELVRWLKRCLIDRQAAIVGLTQWGYSREDAQKFLDARVGETACETPPGGNGQPRGG